MAYLVRPINPFAKENSNIKLALETFSLLTKIENPLRGDFAPGLSRFTSLAELKWPRDHCEEVVSKRAQQPRDQSHEGGDRPRNIGLLRWARRYWQTRRLTGMTTPTMTSVNKSLSE